MSFVLWKRFDKFWKLLVGYHYLNNKKKSNVVFWQNLSSFTNLNSSKLQQPKASLFCQPLFPDRICTPAPTQKPKTNPLWSCCDDTDDVATAIISVGSFEGLRDVYCRLLYAVLAGAGRGSNIICLPESCYWRGGEGEKNSVWSHSVVQTLMDCLWKICVSFYYRASPVCCTSWKWFPTIWGHIVLAEE